MPGPELGTGGQGSQHILFIWDLESKDQRKNLRGSKNVPEEVLENSGKGKQKYTIVLILTLKKSVSLSGHQEPRSSQAPALR